MTHLPVVAQAGRDFVKLLEPLVEGLVERHLFVLKHLCHSLLRFHQLREDSFHQIDHLLTKQQHTAKREEQRRYRQTRPLKAYHVNGIVS